MDYPTLAGISTLTYASNHCQVHLTYLVKLILVICNFFPIWALIYFP